MFCIIPIYFAETRLMIEKVYVYKIMCLHLSSDGHLFLLLFTHFITYVYG